jgi:2,4-dienoyl-CoA reductase-like NADH-dependent reductase (Old Yellow Enzyme family)
MHPVIGKLLSPFLPLILPAIPKPIYSYNVQAAEAIKKLVSIPVIVVGGIISMDEIAGILENEKADFVSMCRPFIVEPDIVKKFKQGISRDAKCMYCNYCTVAQFSRSIRCYYGKI